MAVPSHRREGPVVNSDTFARLADFVLRRPASVFPTPVLDQARYLFLDTLGIAIAAGPMEAGRIARDVAVLLYGSGDPHHSARMLFDGRRASIAGAAYAVATQIDNLDGHDGYSPTKGHIGVAVVPALAALAEARPDLTGPEALAEPSEFQTVIGKLPVAAMSVAGTAAVTWVADTKVVTIGLPFQLTCAWLSKPVPLTVSV